MTAPDRSTPPDTERRDRQPMKFGIPDTAPKTAVDAGFLAECEGWRVVPSYVSYPERNVTLRFRRENYPPIWAAWRGGAFWRAYVNTAQRLSFTDLKAVLKDPAMLMDVDPEWPYGPPEDTEYYRADHLMCGRLGHVPQKNKKGETKCARCTETLNADSYRSAKMGESKA